MARSDTMTQKKATTYPQQLVNDVRLVGWGYLRIFMTLMAISTTFCVINWLQS